MIDLRPGRRQVLKGAAAVGAATSASGLVERVLTAMADLPSCGSLGDIEHVVILVQENRSFDNYFGTYPGVRGFDDRSLDSQYFSQRSSATDPSQHMLPFHIDTGTPSMPTLHPGMCTNDIDHQWHTQHTVFNGGTPDRWVLTHDAVDTPKYGPLTMGYYQRSDLSFYYALADNFTLCDNYFCSVVGGTDINRLYVMTATMDPDGFDGGGQFLDTRNDRISPVLGKGGRWVTYPEVLQQHGVDWLIYQNGPDALLDNVLPYFEAYRHPLDGTPFQKELFRRAFATQYAAFAADVKNDRLPKVSWVLSSAVTESEHPPEPLTFGERFSYDLIETLLSNPAVFAKTALLITYDENGGFFDHVVPPHPVVGTPGETLSATLGTDAQKEYGNFRDPVGLGFRVPMLLVSPFSRSGGSQAIVASGAYDHTSILRFLEAVTGAPVPRRNAGTRTAGLSSWREQHTDALTSAFNFASPNRSALDFSAVVPSTTDPRIATECPATLPTVFPEPLGGLTEPYPYPKDQVMPKQETPRGAVVHPSGPCAANGGPTSGNQAGPNGGGVAAVSGLPNTGRSDLPIAAELLAGAGLGAAAWWAHRRRTVAAEQTRAARRAASDRTPR